MNSPIKPFPKPPLLVTAAIVHSKGRVLLAQRSFDAKVEAGKWEFPGGKVESGEQPEAAVVREIREELDFDVAIDAYFDFSSHVYVTEASGTSLHIILLCYICRVVGEQSPRAIEAAEIRWVTREELSTFDFAAADKPLVQRLSSEWERFI